MGKPSEKALRTALLAPEHASPHTPNLDTGTGSLVALAQALKDRIGVLQILDGTAPEWPGIQACMESMVELAQDVSQQLQASRDIQEKAAADVFVKQSEIRQLQGQLAENGDALAAAEDETTRTLEEHQQVTQQLNTCKQNMEQLQIQHERKVGATLTRASCDINASVSNHLCSPSTAPTRFSAAACYAIREPPSALPSIVLRLALQQIRTFSWQPLVHRTPSQRVHLHSASCVGHLAR